MCVYLCVCVKLNTSSFSFTLVFFFSFSSLLISLFFIFFIFISLFPFPFFHLHPAPTPLALNQCSAVVELNITWPTVNTDSIYYYLGCPYGSVGNLTRVCCGTATTGFSGMRLDACTYYGITTYLSVNTQYCYYNPLDVLQVNATAVDIPTVDQAMVDALWTSLETHSTTVRFTLGTADISNIATAFTKLTTTTITRSFVLMSGLISSLMRSVLRTTDNTLQGAYGVRWLADNGLANAAIYTSFRAALTKGLSLYGGTEANFGGINYVTSFLLVTNVSVLAGNFSWPNPAMTVTTDAIPAQFKGTSLRFSNESSRLFNATGSKMVITASPAGAFVPNFDSIISNVTDVMFYPSVNSTNKTVERMIMTFTGRLSNEFRGSVRQEAATFFNVHAPYVDVTSLIQDSNGVYALLTVYEGGVTFRNETIPLALQCVKYQDDTGLWSNTSDCRMSGYAVNATSGSFTVECSCTVAEGMYAVQAKSSAVHTESKPSLLTT